MEDPSPLSSFISLTFLFPTCFSPVFPIAPPSLPTTWRSPSSTEPSHVGRRECHWHWAGDWCQLRWRIRLRKMRTRAGTMGYYVVPVQYPSFSDVKIAMLQASNIKLRCPMGSWLFPASKKVYICIFWSSITEVVTVGLTSVKKNGQNSNFSGRFFFF